MEAVKEAEIVSKIENASAVILNRLRTQEQIISAGVDMTNALADIQFLLDTGYASICARPENAGQPTALINRIYKAEMATEHRLKTIVRGLKATLKNMEYGGYK